MDKVDELGQQFRRVKIHRNLSIVVAVSAVESAGVVTSQLKEASSAYAAVRGVRISALLKLNHSHLVGLQSRMSNTVCSAAG